MTSTEANSVKPPRLASTILLLRDGASGLEVFMVVRHHQIDFASGALVFPGGSVEPGDGDLADDAMLCPPIAGVSPDLMALRVGAIRETFEECGLLLAREFGNAQLVGRDIAARVDQDGGRTAFAETMERHRLAPAVDLLTPYSHWVTPTFMPKRFDTHFFLAAAPGDQLAAHDGRESVDSIWINPRTALEDSRNGRYTVVFATRLNLEMLAQANTVAEALAQAARRRIVTVIPELVEKDGARRLRLPLEAGYGLDLFDV